jgi:hypothetical protein
MRAPHGGARPMSASQLVAEGRRAVVRALRRRLAELDTSAFENLCSSLLDKMGMRDVRVAKRSREGPLYLARQRRGVSDLRVAVKLVRGGREISRGDVQELRKDLAHYSAQMGLVLAPGEAGRDARGEASAAGQAPVALYAGEALPEELIALRVGVTVQTVDVPDMDEAFFAALARRRDERHREPPPPPPEQPPALQAQTETPTPTQSPPTEPQLQPAAIPLAEALPIEPDMQVIETPSETPVETPAEIPSEEPRDARRRRGGREDRPRATTPAEQAWGQPAGTKRFAPPPGPTVAVPQETPQSAPEPAPAAETPAAPSAGGGSDDTGAV